MAFAIDTRARPPLYPRFEMQQCNNRHLTAVSHTFGNATSDFSVALWRASEVAHSIGFVALLHFVHPLALVRHEVALPDLLELVAVIAPRRLGADADPGHGGDPERLEQFGELIGRECLSLPVCPRPAFRLAEMDAYLGGRESILVSECHLDVGQQHGTDRFTILGGESRRGVASAVRPI